MVDRRQFVKGGAAGLAGILVSRRAPAHAQETRLHLLYRVDFIPQGEAELKRQLADYGKQMKMEVVLETINENDLQTRITATIMTAVRACTPRMASKRRFSRRFSQRAANAIATSPTNAPRSVLRALEWAPS